MWPFSDKRRSEENNEIAQLIEKLSESLHMFYVTTELNHDFQDITPITPELSSLIDKLPSNSVMVKQEIQNSIKILQHKGLKRSYIRDALVEHGVKKKPNYKKLLKVFDKIFVEL